MDSTGGASVGASAAINAFIGIDFVDIAFRDSVGGTFAHASAASNTIIANNVSHSFEFKKLILIVSVSGKSTAFLFLDKLNWIFFDGECFFDKSFSSLTGNISMVFAFYSYFRKTIEKDIIHMGMFCCRRFGIGAATKVAALAVRRPAAYSFRFFCRYACAAERHGLPKCPLSRPVSMSAWLATFIFARISIFVLPRPCCSVIKRWNCERIIAIHGARSI